jgi:hypothetical protein
MKNSFNQIFLNANTMADCSVIVIVEYLKSNYKYFDLRLQLNATFELTKTYFIWLWGCLTHYNQNTQQLKEFT